MWRNLENISVVNFLCVRMLLTALCFTLFIHSTCARQFGGIEREPAETHTSVVGGKVALPCDIISPMADDEVYLVLWYKDDIATPIYSLDARKGHVEQARHASSDHFSRRAYFNTVPRPAVLEVSSLKVEDEGEYRCRVDFQKAQTRNYQIAVKVMVPPGKPVIKNNFGNSLKGVIGPYNEGDNLYLLCESKGGKPPPSLTWWRNSVLVDDKYEIISSSTMVTNELMIPSLERRDLMAEYSCHATNNNITLPVSTSVTIDLNFKPLLVTIQGQRQPLSSGRMVQFQCTTQGSRPPAVITWRKGATRFKESQEDVTTGGNSTVSIFSFTPSPEDHGKFLYCQAENPLIPGSVIEDGWKLEVHYPPQLTLRLGSKLRHSNILEGNDVYFECNIKATPWVSETGWRFEGQELHTNISAGIIVSNQSLVLQKVRRINRGRYSCTATNSEGQAESNHVYLRVQYSPVCRPGQQTVYGAMLHYPVEIACEVESDPDDVTFRWEFNSSSGTLELVPTVTTGRRSVVNYIPRSDQDYGTLSCWGRNHVGLQRMPCLFVVIPAEPPSAVHNCTVNGETERSFRISCFEGKDGGLNQYFQMEVRNAATEQVIVNATAQTADFAARGLSPGSLYLITLYAVNAKGRSAPVVIKAATLATPESQTRKEDVWELSVSPVLLILVAVFGGIVLVAFSVVVYLKIQGRRNMRKGNQNAQQKTTTTCQDLENHVCNHCMCDNRREEDQTKHFPTENYVMIETTKPGLNCDDNAIKTETVFWRKIPIHSSDGDNYINPRLSIKLPLKNSPSTEFDRRKSPPRETSTSEKDFSHKTNTLLLLKQEANCESQVVSAIRHTDV